MQFSMWREYFSMDELCIVETDFMAHNPTEALQIVANFIGLSPFDWSQVDTRANVHGPKAHETPYDLPVRTDVRDRMLAFFERYGRRVYDLVKKFGTVGCKPSKSQK